MPRTSIVAVMLTGCLWQIGLAETPELSRQEYRSRAARQLDTARLEAKARDVRRCEMVDELRMRSTSFGLILKRSVRKGTLPASRSIQQDRDRASRVSMATPGRNLIPKVEEEKLGDRASQVLMVTPGRNLIPVVEEDKLGIGE